MGVLASTAALSGGLLLGSIVKAREARRERAAARRIDEKRNRLQTARQAVEQVRQAQIARAQVVQQAESTGVGESSSVQGALGSIQSQAGSNIAFAQDLFNLQKDANNRLIAADKAEGMSQAFSKLSSLAFQAA